MHRIYGLTELSTGVIRYIGQTSRELSARLYMHVWDSLHAKGHKTLKEAWICSRGGFAGVGIVLLEETEDWQAREKYWISAFPNLLNHTEGVEGITGYRHTEQAKKAIAEANKLKAGLKRSPEACENIRLGQLGKKLSAEHKAKIGAAGRLRKDTPETRAKKKAIWSTPERREECRKNAFKRWQQNGPELTQATN